TSELGVTEHIEGDPCVFVGAEAGVGPQHPPGDPGEAGPPAGRAEGAHPSAQDAQPHPGAAEQHQPQGDQRGRRQPGRRQQSTRHRLHRLTHVTEHGRQRQGSTHTLTHSHKHTHTRVDTVFFQRGVSPNIMTS
ncbi:unnamed protein product, partial [Tetraodon nigroviridis]